LSVCLPAEFAFIKLWTCGFWDFHFPPSPRGRHVLPSSVPFAPSRLPLNADHFAVSFPKSLHASARFLVPAIRRLSCVDHSLFLGSIFHSSDLRRLPRSCMTIPRWMPRGTTHVFPAQFLLLPTPPPPPTPSFCAPHFVLFQNGP